MRVLCDTNVLVRAVMSPTGPAAELLTILAGDAHTLITSSAVLAEVYDVLRRPAIRRFHNLSAEQIRRVVSRLAKAAAVVQLPPAIPAAVPHDPQDDAIVLSAILGKAQAICTLDKHLRAQVVIAYCAGHGIRIVTDEALLHELRAS